MLAAMSDERLAQLHDDWVFTRQASTQDVGEMLDEIERLRWCEIAMTTKKKLLKLADFLEFKVKNRWFDLEYWADREFPEKKCGTAACAAGWATVCFPRSGLTLLPSVRFAGGGDLEVAYETLRGFDACMAFFKINRDEAEHLFDPDEYSEGRRGRMSVVRRLRTVANKL